MSIEKLPFQQLSEFVRYYRAERYMVKAEVHTHHVHFEMYQTQGEMTDGTPAFQDDPPEWQMEGDVKWDGCSNWMSGRGCYIHFCEREYLLEFGKVMQACWDWANELIRIDPNVR